MKFRHLKHSTWIGWFDCFILDSTDYYNVYISCLDGTLQATYEWEYDNGLYVETGNEPFALNWKSIKQNMSYRKWNGKKEKYWVTLYNGKCSECGKKTTKQEFCSNEGSICTECLDNYWISEEDEEDE